MDFHLKTYIHEKLLGRHGTYPPYSDRSSSTTHCIILTNFVFPFSFPSPRTLVFISKMLIYPINTSLKFHRRVQGISGAPYTNTTIGALKLHEHMFHTFLMSGQFCLKCSYNFSSATCLRFSSRAERRDSLRSFM